MSGPRSLRASSGVSTWRGSRCPKRCSGRSSASPTGRRSSCRPDPAEVPPSRNRGPMSVRIIPIILCLALFVLGCSYAISPDVKAAADRSLRFEKIAQDPSAHRGKIVILGGTIVAARSVKNVTQIEVAQKELDYWGKPRRTDHTGGNFIIQYAGRLDTMMVYVPGRELTVAAEVTGTEAPTLEGSTAAWPLLLSRELKLWPVERKSWDKPQWMDPLYDRNASPRYGD